MSSKDYYKFLVSKIAQLRRKENRIDFLNGFSVFTGVLIIAILISALVENIFILSPSERWIIILVNALILSGGFIYFCVRPLARYLNLIRSYDDLTLSYTVGKTFPDLKDRLCNAITLYNQTARPEFHASGQLASAFLADVYEQAHPLDFTQAADRTRINAPFRFSVITLIFFIFAWIVFDQPIGSAINRLLHPNTVIAPVLPFEIIVKPGHGEILYGQTATIHIRIHALIPNVIVPNKISVYTKPEGVDQFREEVIRNDSAGYFSYAIPNCKQSFTYYAEASNRTFGQLHSVRSGQFDYIVVKRPSIKRFQAELTSPAYTKLGSRLLDENTGDITALKGTRVKWTIEATKPLRKASVIFQDSSFKS